MPSQGFETHEHPAVVHGHEHFHLTHYAHQNEPANLEHLLSSHGHDHNHAAVQHLHVPHDNADAEHRREAHVHDHAHP